MIVDSLLSELNQESVTTRKMLERVPSDKLEWRPHEKSYSMGQLAQHLANIFSWLNVTLDTAELDFAAEMPQDKPVSSTTELLRYFDAKATSAKDRLVSATEDELLNDTWTARSGDQVFFTLPKEAVLRTFVLNHVIHHRAQLGVYLRLLDVPVPATYGPTADEQQ